MKKYTPELKPAFSLMEMMIVLLIVAIIAAASAPMVTRKMARNAGSGDSPFVFTGANNTIAFPDQTGSTLLGSLSLPNNANGKLYINSVTDNGNIPPQIAFGQDNQYRGRLELGDQNSIAIGTGTIGNNSIAIGSRTANDNEVVIGGGTNVGVKIGSELVLSYNGTIQLGGINMTKVSNGYQITGCSITASGNTYNNATITIPHRSGYGSTANPRAERPEIGEAVEEEVNAESFARAEAVRDLR